VDGADLGAGALVAAGDAACDHRRELGEAGPDHLLAVDASPGSVAIWETSPCMAGPYGVAASIVTTESAKVRSSVRVSPGQGHPGHSGPVTLRPQFGFPGTSGMHGQ
jgi:hypothetical protein